jgi:hypothetical protein
MLLHMGFFNGVPPHEINARMEAHLQKADRIQIDRQISFEEFVPYFEYLMQQMQQRGAVLQPPAQPTQFYGQPGYNVNYGRGAHQAVLLSIQPGSLLIVYQCTCTHSPRRSRAVTEFYTRAQPEHL